MSSQISSEKMATDNSRTENNYNEKSDITQDHVENITPSNESEDVDATNYEGNNKYAVKGDESDGKIVWTWKTRIAASCLVLLYVGW